MIFSLDNVIEVLQKEKRVVQSATYQNLNGAVAMTTCGNDQIDKFNRMDFYLGSYICWLF